MPKKAKPLEELPELDATTLLCLEIDIAMRDVWEVLDQVPDMWDDLILGVTAMSPPRRT